MTTRTLLQNKSLHKGCTLLAEKLNDAGLDMRTVLKPEIEIPWTGESVRVYMFNEIAKRMYEDRTSHELSTTEIQEVWNVLNRHLAQTQGVEQAWPERHGEG